MAKGNYDFILDLEKIDNLKTKLGEAKEGIATEIENIYTLIGPNNLGASWGGETYNNFVEDCNKFKPALLTLVDTLETFKTIIEKDIESVDSTTVKKIEQALMNIGGGE